MRLHGTDPDIQTLLQRMVDGDIDLQPDFQRGEVWPDSKKQRLIDSILREWHVPPIHAVEDPDTRRHLILDGQQRLVAIRDFFNGEISVNGRLEPISTVLADLHGKRYRELPDTWKRKFLQFTIRFFRITDYDPAEPGELFYRLNQPSALTSAEVRNAFIGKTREQVKQIVRHLGEEGLDDRFWGFSNARMALDDVVARALLLLEEGSLLKRTGSTTLADRYRQGTPFSAASEEHIIEGARLLRSLQPHLREKAFNKATAQSWLVFAACIANRIGIDDALLGFADFFVQFERARTFAGLIGADSDTFPGLQQHFGSSGVEAMLGAYDDRAKSRVADTLSVALRDFVLWLSYLSEFAPRSIHQIEGPQAQVAVRLFSSKPHLHTQRDVEELVSKLAWGVEL